MMQIRILLVDDEAGIVQALKRLLHTEDYLIFEASDGEQATEILTRETIDLMITDYQMPNCDGITLCQRARAISPATYRLLLSGEVDYHILKEAWQSGDVHRFVAKPWDNMLLQLDIEEGIRQHELLKHTEQMRRNISRDQPLVLMDDNWVIRLANPAFCDMMEAKEEHLLGQNLFSSQFSNSAVTQEAEVTRQVEHNEVWLGHFSLVTRSKKEIPAWLAISPLGEHYRLGVCQFVTPERASLQSQREQMKSFADGHEPAVVTESNHASPIMLIECPEENVSNKQESEDVFDQLRSIAPDDCQIYHSPRLNVFLLVLADTLGEDRQLQLQLAIETMIAFGAHQLPPKVTVELQPSNITDWNEWLRQRLGFPAREDSEDADNTISQQVAVPVFDTHGQLVALESNMLTEYSSEQWDDWFLVLTNAWIQHFDAKLELIIDASSLNSASTEAFLPALQRAREHMPINCNVIMDEETFIDESEDTIKWHDALARYHCKRILSQFGRSFLNARQILNLPIDGICLAPEFLTNLQSPKTGAQGLRLLHKLHEQGVLIYARNIHNSNTLAISHKAKISWISGSIMAQELALHELHWYGPESKLG